jgi:HK97 family phage portal protein
MGILSRLGVETKAGATLDLFREIYGGRTTSTGKTVNVSTAIEVAAVFAVCRVIGEGIAQVPLKLMRDVGKTKLPAKERRLFKLLAYKPNRWQTSFEYRETLVWHVVLTGNHYSFINRQGGEIVELYPLDPSTVKVLFDRGTISYEVTPAGGGEPQTFPAEAIWHVRGPSWSGWYGLEAVKLAREAIGVALAAEEAVGSLHKNGVQSSGVYSVEGTLNDAQYESLSKWVNTHHAGAANAGKTLIIDRHATWLNTQMKGTDAQTLENRKFQIEEICRFANVMPIMIGHSDKTTTYASATAMFHAHYKSTLAPWYQRLEQSMDANLLTDREFTQGYYCNFTEEGWLRGSMTETKDAVLGYVNGGILLPNEGRALLDLNPVEGGDTMRVPANIVGASPAPTGE